MQLKYNIKPHKKSLVKWKKNTDYILLQSVQNHFPSVKRLKMNIIWISMVEVTVVVFFVRRQSCPSSTQLKKSHQMLKLNKFLSPLANLHRDYFGLMTQKNALYLSDDAILSVVVIALIWVRICLFVSFFFIKGHIIRDTKWQRNTCLVVEPCTFLHGIDGLPRICHISCWQWQSL